MNSSRLPGSTAHHCITAFAVLVALEPGRRIPRSSRREVDEHATSVLGVWVDSLKIYCVRKDCIMLFRAKSLVPARRQIFDDAVFADESKFYDDAMAAAYGCIEDFDGHLTKRDLHGYVVGQKLGCYNTDCNTITDALPDRPLIAVGSHQTNEGYQDAWFIVESMHFVRSEVCNAYNSSFRCWDENGRLFAEAYDREARDSGDATVGNLFEIRQLNERGLRLFDSCAAAGKDVPVERLFSSRYSDPPRVAELAFAFPREQWVEAAPSPSESAESAQRVARHLSGTFEGGKVKIGKGV